MKKKFVVLKNKTDKKPERLLSYDEKYLIAELTQSKNALDAAYSCFENATDPDKFLLEKAKAANLSLAIPLNLII